MRLPEKIYKDEIDTVITAEIENNEDISTASTIEFRVRKPSGTEVTWDAVYALDDGTQYLSHELLEGDVDEAGDYYVQPYIELGSWKGRGNTFKIKVWEHYS